MLRTAGVYVEGSFAMRLFRAFTACTLFLVVHLLLISAGQAVAQQRPGIRAQIIAPEGCSISDPVDTENLFNFIATQVQALSFAQAGERASRQTSPAGQGAPPSQVPNFVGLRENRIDNTCASFILSPYSNSKIEGVAAAAKYLVIAYQDLANMSDEMLGISLRQGLLNNPGSTLFQISDLDSRRQEILKNMTVAMNLSLLLLNRTDAEGKPDMILSAEERHSLLDYLNSKFPLKEDAGTIGPSGDFVKQAALIRSFLNGGYKLANSK